MRLFVSRLLVVALCLTVVRSEEAAASTSTGSTDAALKDTRSEAELMANATAEYEAANYQVALNTYETIVTKFPKNVDAWFQLGLIHHFSAQETGSQSNMAWAIQCFQRVVRLEPLHNTAHALIAKNALSLNADRRDDAIKHLKQHVKAREAQWKKDKQGSDPDVDVDESRRLLQRALSDTASVLASAGRTLESIPFLERLLSLNLHHGPALLSLGVHLPFTEDKDSAAYDKALKALEQAYALNSNDPGLVYLINRLRVRTNAAAATLPVPQWPQTLKAADLPSFASSVASVTLPPSIFDALMRAEAIVGLTDEERKDKYRQIWAPYVQEFKAAEAARGPVVVSAKPTDVSRAFGWYTDVWSRDYLAKSAGDTKVMALRRSSERVPFEVASGIWQAMSLRSFLDVGLMDKFASPDDAKAVRQAHLYSLHFQPPDRFKNTSLAAPLSSPALSADIPTPFLIEHWNMSLTTLWMGVADSASDTASRRHLRFAADALQSDLRNHFIVSLRGRKHILLFPPSDAPYLYTAGNVKSVQANGRIVYQPPAAPVVAGQDKRDRVAHREAAPAGLSLLPYLPPTQSMLAELGLTTDAATPACSAADASSCAAPASSTGSDSEAAEKTQAERITKLLRDQFPLFSKAHPQQVWLEQGEALMVPAGWFAQITSFGPQEHTVGSTGTSAGTHMAVCFSSTSAPAAPAVASASAAATTASA